MHEKQKEPRDQKTEKLQWREKQKLSLWMRIDKKNKCKWKLQTVNITMKYKQINKITIVKTAEEKSRNKKM